MKSKSQSRNTGRRIRFYLKWTGVAFAILAAVALALAWNKQGLQEAAKPTAATRTAEGALQNTKPPVLPTQRSPIAAAVPERPPRERVDRPGEEGSDDP